MRRTYKYAAVTRDKGNAADGHFPTASTQLLTEYSRSVMYHGFFLQKTKNSILINTQKEYL
jgi:hypothetical protein